METIVVTRHPATLDRLIELDVAGVGPEVPVLGHASADAVRGRRVVGNLPYHLAGLAREIVVPDLRVPRELRGTELDLEALRGALPRREDVLCGAGRGVRCHPRHRLFRRLLRRPHAAALEEDREMITDCARTPLRPHRWKLVAFGPPPCLAAEVCRRCGCRRVEYERPAGGVSFRLTRLPRRRP